MFSATSWVLTKLPCGTPISCSLTFVLFYNTRRSRRKSFLHWKVCIFLQKFMFSATSWVLKKWSFNFNIKLITLWRTPIIVPWRLCCFKIREEIGEKLFFTGKFSSFFKSLCFQQPLGSWRNDPLTSTLIVKLPCGTPISCSLTFVLFYNTRRSRRKSFLHWKVSKIYVFSNLLGPEEMIF